MSFFFKSFLFIFIFISLNACQRKGANDEGLLQQKFETSDTAKYVRLAEGKERLESWSKSNTFIYHEISEPDDLHPTNGNSGQRSELNLYTQYALVVLDRHTLQPSPGLVKEIPLSANGLEYKYELRNEAIWDDGTAVTAGDVIFTFKANKSPLTNNPHAKPDLENIKDIRVDPLNQRAFTIYMKKQFIKNISFLIDYPVLQKKFFDKKNVLDVYTFAQLDQPKFNAGKDLVAWSDDFNDPKNGRDINHLTGLGAYKIVRWDVGQSLILVRKKNHWTAGTKNFFETSYPDKIICKLNRDANSQALEFKAQAYDGSTSLSTQVLLQLRKDKEFNKNYTSTFTTNYNYYYIGMNTKPDGIIHKKLFTDKNVRRAMAYLVPIEIMNKVINKGKNKRMLGPVSPLKREYNSNLKPLAFDLAKARKLLDKAGWVDTDGDFIRDKIIDGEKVQLNFNLNYMTTQITWKEIAQLVSEAMYKAGIRANLTPLDFAVHYDKAKVHDFDMMIAAWTGDATPDDFTQLWHTSSWSSKGSNFVGFGNNYTDALIDSIKYTVDDARRFGMVQRFQQKVYEEQPYIFLFSGVRRSVIHKRFGNQEVYFEKHSIAINTLKLIP